jgi:hypothetical protein
MNPNENQQPSVPTDYLNQIAPKPTIRIGNITQNKPIFFGGIAIILLVIIILAGSILAGGNRSSEQLAVSLITTETATTDATSKIQSSQLLSFNSNLNIYLINTIREIESVLAKNNVSTSNLNSTAKSDKTNVKLLAKLEDARLNATYDRTYAREMAYRLDTILTLMRQIYTSTSDSSLKTTVENAYNDLIPTQRQFADFNAADS